MPAPETFSGARKTFIESFLPEYTKAVKEGRTNELKSDVCRRFFLRWPPELPDSYAPSQQQLDAINDAAAPPETTPPDLSSMSEAQRAEYAESVTKLGERVRMIRGQIGRRLKYIYDQKNKAATTGKDAPYAALARLLTAPASEKPRKQPAIMMWKEQNKQHIRDVYDIALADWRRERASKELPKSKRDTAAPATLYNSVLISEFNKLTSDEKAEWELKSSRDHQEREQEWLNRTVDFSTDPEDRQKCINGLTTFIQPILEAVTEATGWATTFIAGGPEPADGGKINIVNLHSGTTPGHVGMTFGSAMRASYKSRILPLFGAFLLLCYSRKECKARALAPDVSMASLATTLKELGIGGGNPGGEMFSENEIFEGQDLSESVAQPQAIPTAGADSPARSCSPPILMSPKALESFLGRDGSTSSLPSTQSLFESLPVEQLDPIVVPSAMPNAEPQVEQLDPMVVPSAMPIAPPLRPRPRPLTEARLSLTSAEATKTTAPKSTPPNGTPLDELGMVAIPHDAPPVPTDSHDASPAPTSTSTAPATVPRNSSDASPTPHTSPTALDKSLPSFPASHPPPTETLPNDPTTVPRTSPSHPSPTPNESVPNEFDVARPRGSADGTAMELCSEDSGLGNASPARSPCPPPAVAVSSRRRRRSPDRDDESAPEAKRTRARRTAPAEQSGRSTRQQRQRPTTSTTGDQAPSSNSNVTSLSSVIVPRGAPGYAVDAVSEFRKLDDVPSWLELVQRWLDFEKKSKYHESTGLPRGQPKSRPDAVGLWIGQGRRVGFRPPVVDAHKFAQRFSLWYGSIQPTWREWTGADDLVSFSETPQKVTKTTWDSLNRSGPNGFLNIIAALYFWDQSIRALPNVGFRDRRMVTDARRLWTAYGDDVLLVLQSMLGMKKA